MVGIIKRRVLKDIPVRARDERGIILILGSALIVILLMISVLVVDSLSGERAARDLQDTVDAAALAGALQLRPVKGKSIMDGTIEAGSDQYAYVGWPSAKRAAMLFIRQHRVYGDTQGVLQGPFQGAGFIDTEELPDSPYRFETFYFPSAFDTQYTLTIQRGIYFAPAGQEKQFYSLEPGSQYVCESSDPVTRVPNGQRPTDPRPHYACNGAPGTATATRPTMLSLSIFGQLFCLDSSTPPCQPPFLCYGLCMLDNATAPASATNAVPTSEKILGPNPHTSFASAFADSVHVTLTMSRLPSLLPGFAKFGATSNITKEALATPDRAP